jgi:hypothetical protein
VLDVDLLPIHATLNSDRTMARNNMSNSQMAITITKKKLQLGKYMHTFASSIAFILHRNEWMQYIAPQYALQKARGQAAYSQLKILNRISGLLQ